MKFCFIFRKPRKEISLEPEPTVRGHARKELTGFSCEKCRKVGTVYSIMNCFASFFIAKD